MCVIIILKAGQKLSANKLDNAVLNNPDGFGMVIKEKGKLKTFRYFEPEGMDPEFVAKVLEEHKATDRYIHLRHGTVGKLSLDNVHPFKIVDNARANHQVVFMHNGTMHSWKPSTGDRSDSLEYATEFLSPFLYKFNGDKGVADSSDPFLKRILDRDFNNSVNRGLLVSNKHGPLYLGTWKEITDGDNGEIKVSNDDYFSGVNSTRRRFRVEPEPIKTFTQTQTQSTKVSALPLPVPAQPRNPSSQVTELKSIDLGRQITFLEAKDIEDLYSNGSSVLTDEDISYMPCLSIKEIMAFTTEHPENAAKLMEHIITRFSVLFTAYEEVADKLDKSTKKNATFASELGDLRAEYNQLFHAGRLSAGDQ